MRSAGPRGSSRDVGLAIPAVTAASEQKGAEAVVGAEIEPVGHASKVRKWHFPPVRPIAAFRQESGAKRTSRRLRLVCVLDSPQSISESADDSALRRAFCR
jgi:hypothetical protein